MTNHSLLLAGVSVVSMLVSVAVSEAKNLIVILPENAKVTKDEVLLSLNRMFLVMQPGDALLFLDGKTQNSIARIVIPADDAKYQNRNVRIRYFAAQLEKARKRVEAFTPETALDDTQELDLPATMAEIAQNIRATLPEGPVEVLVLGSGIYHDDRDPAFSMRGTTVLSDSHLRYDASPFSVARKETMLEGVSLHYCTTNPWELAEHKERVERFTAIWLGAMKGRLSTFTANIPACFERAIGGLADGRPVFEPTGLDNPPARIKLNPGQLAEARPVEAPAMQEREGRSLAEVENEGGNAPAFLNRDVAIATEPPTTTRGAMKIGIIWPDLIDLDIYARGGNGKPYVYFGNKQSDEATFDKDFTSGATDEAFEYVRFTTDVNLTDVEAYVNYYGGQATRPCGKIRVEFEGKVYEKTFCLGASNGNGGGKLIGFMKGPHWHYIDLKAILGVS